MNGKKLQDFVFGSGQSIVQGGNALKSPQVEQLHVGYKNQDQFNEVQFVFK